MIDREGASRTLFDRWSRSYDEGRITPWFQYTQRLAIENLALAPSSAVLDVGCGTGFAVLSIASQLDSGRACGIDISPGMIAAANAKIPRQLEGKVEFREASSASLPYGEATFDHVLCTNSFHHYPDPVLALAEMKRVLRPGGELVIFENAPDLSWYTWAWDKVLRAVEKGHVKYYPSRELRKLIEDADFEDVQLLELRNLFRKHGKLFASIQLWKAKKL